MVKFYRQNLIQVVKLNKNFNCQILWQNFSSKIRTVTKLHWKLNSCWKILRRKNMLVGGGEGGYSTIHVIQWLQWQVYQVVCILLFFKSPLNFFIFDCVRLIEEIKNIRKEKNLTPTLRFVSKSKLIIRGKKGSEYQTSPAPECSSFQLSFICHFNVLLEI